MTINLCFRGWLTGVELDEATDTITGETIQLKGMNETEVLEKLNNGTLAVTLETCLQNATDSEIEIDDFDAPLNLMST